MTLCTEMSDKKYSKTRITLTRITLAFIVISIFAIAAVTEPAKAGITRKQKIKTIDILKKYFKNVKTASGRFVHITDQNKKLGGKFYMALPGNLRFEYDGGQLNIVASGAWLNLDYPKKKEAVRYPIGSTPLDLILKENIDLENDLVYLDYIKKKKFFVVEIAFAEKTEIGSVKLFFIGEKQQLLQWQVIDAQGKANTIAISEVVYNKPISKRKFILKDYVNFDDNR